MLLVCLHGSSPIHPPMREYPMLWVVTLSLSCQLVTEHMFGAYNTWWKALVLMWTCLGLMVGSLGPDVDMFGAYGWEPWS